MTESREQNMRYIFFTRFGKLEGLVTRADMVSLMTSHVPHAGALACDERQQGQLDDNQPQVLFEAR